MWKWRPVESLEIQPQDFHPSPRPWKSLRDSHIPTRATISLIICRGTQDQTSEKCYPCSRIEVLPMFPAGHIGPLFLSRERRSGTNVFARDRPLGSKLLRHAPW